MWWVYIVEEGRGDTDTAYGPYETFEEARDWHVQFLPEVDLWTVSQWSDGECYVYDNTEYGKYIGAFREDGTLKAWSLVRS